MVKENYRERYQTVEEVLKEIQVDPEPEPPELESLKPRLWYVPLLLATIVLK